jgi:hypothetical protein
MDRTSRRDTFEGGDLELYNSFARMARVTRSYVVYPATPAPDDLGRTVDTFEEAFDLLRENAEWLLGVVVEWKFGGKTGLDVVLYSAPAGTTDTVTFAEQRIDFLVNRKIALAMHREHHREAARKDGERTSKQKYDVRASANY